MVMECELYLNPGIIIVNHVGNRAFNFTLVRHLRILCVKGKLSDGERQILCWGLKASSKVGW